MKQFSFSIKTSKDVDDCIQEFIRKCQKQYSSILVSIFSSLNDETNVVLIIDKLAEFLPNAIITGSSTSGEIFCGDVSIGSTIINFMVFSSTQLEVHAVDLASTSAEENVDALVSYCKKKNFLVGVEFLIANNDVKLYKFLHCFQETQSDLFIFGGVAGSINKSKPYVFAGRNVLREGIVVIFFIGHELNIQVNASWGWRPLGPWFQITSMMSEQVIVELDNRPANLVYEKYLAISREDLEKENLLFPLLLERNGHSLLRLPATATPEGGLVMSADCRLGERVRLAYGDPDEIIRAVQGMQKTVADFEPQAIMIFNCVTRRFFLRKDAKNEIYLFNNIAPSVGFYTGGEVARMENGDTSLLNMTLVVVSFREGNKTSNAATAEYSSESSLKSLTGTMKLVRHLTHFIAETSKELELANQQLAELASRDRLTGLYNRGEIESILKKEIDNQRKDSKYISAILMDIDNFKHVNDIYGHDIGDEVLKWTGQVLRNNTRRADAVGRWGGEEFFIFLPGATLAAATDVAERIRQVLCDGFSLPDGKKVTASFGVAECSEQSSYNDFYKLLDSSLYRAKQTGKNRVCVAK